LLYRSGWRHHLQGVHPSHSTTTTERTKNSGPKTSGSIYSYLSKATCEHTRILGALVEHPQGNLEEIQQENPAEHPRGACRPSGPQGLDVRHRELRSQPCTASSNAGEAIRMLFGQRLRPDPLLRGRTYVRTYPGASRGYRYVYGTEATVCTGDSCYAEVGFNTIMYYVLRQSAQ
jgi:hypothetical protein